MNLSYALIHLDWIRAVRIWLLIAIETTAWECATLLGRTLAAKYGSRA